MKKLSVNAGGKTYDIIIESGFFKELPSFFESNYKGTKLAVITDNNVFDLYGKDLITSFKSRGLTSIPIVFDAGETNKNLSTLSKIYHVLADNSFTRSDIIVALGGGVTGDMAGLAAATFLRGTKFIQIPTTLLAMVDSSIGGKVAVDMPQGKNLIGTFYQPDLVFTDPSLLRTLSEKQFLNGMAELIKHGIIRDYELFSNLVEKAPSIIDEEIDGYIFESCKIKKYIVEEDEFDNGLRQILNFGHTIGHAIERVENYEGLSHGEAVSVGMSIITQLTENIGLTQKGEAQKLNNALINLGLPVHLPDINIKSLIKAISLDKKNRSGNITIAYIEKIGHGMLKELKLQQLEDSLYELFKNKI